MSTPTGRPAPPHSTALNAFVAGHLVPDFAPPQPEAAAAVEPVPPAPPVAEPVLPAPSHLAPIPTPPSPAAVFQAAPGDRRAQLRGRAAERSRQRRGVSA